MRSCIAARQAAFLALLLFAAAGRAQEEPDALQKQRDDALMKALQLVEAQAHAMNHTATKKLVVHANTVEDAPQATLWAGYADVGATGACQEDIDRLCAEVQPGEGRLAGCLTAQLRAEAAGDTDEAQQVSQGCREELATFKIDRATNINKDVPLAFACRRDVRKLCRPKKAGTDPAAILDCLRTKRRKLSPKCRDKVFAEEVEAAVDFRMDALLNKACAGDAEAMCADVDPAVEGATTECLIDQNARLSAACQKEVLRWEVQRSEDLRLDRRVYRTCSADLRLFCSDLEPGEGRLEACLQDAREQAGFSERCRVLLDRRMEREAANYQLNYGLREYCFEDIERLCEAEREQIALAEGYAADGQVIACLERQRDAITNLRCRQEVHRQMEHEAQDIRFDHALAKACKDDAKMFCSQLVPGSARIMHCLHENRPKLAQQCTEQLLEHDIRLAEDIDFKWPLRHACVVEIQLLCSTVPQGHARVVRCLQDHLGDAEMSTECAHEVQRDQTAASSDFRLNYRLRRACGPDVAALCQAATKQCVGRGCQGLVVECLKSRMGELRGDECRSEVFNVVRMQVFDFRSDAQSQAVCGQDVAGLCANVGSGDGRIHACLQKNMAQLSPACREREQQLRIVQAQDVRLQPAMAACTQEMAVLCADAEPGKGRMQQCLARNMGTAGFGYACRRELSVQMEAAQFDYRLDYGVASACQVDAQALCKAELAAGRQAPRQVLDCLVNRYKLLAEPCQNELNRFTRLALWNYKAGGGLTHVCDADVLALCPAAAIQQQRGMLRAGMAGRCLAKRVAQGKELGQACRRLVLVAAPRDLRATFDHSLGMEAVAAKVAQIAHSAGMSATFVDPKARGMQAITVTGWVAAACMAAMVAVLLGITAFAAARWLGGGRRHSYRPVGGYKEGDV